MTDWKKKKRKILEKMIMRALEKVYRDGWMDGSERIFGGGFIET